MTPNNRRTKQNQGQKTTRANRKTPPPAQNPLQEAAELGAQATSVAEVEGVELPDIPEPADASVDELRHAITEARKSKAIYDRAADLAGRRQTNAEQEVKRATEARESADQRSAEARQLQSDLNEQLATLKATTEDLDAREQDIAARELAAEAGFRKQQEQVVAEQRRELERINSEISIAWEAFAAKQNEERKQARERLDREQKERSAELDTRERDLAKESSDLAKQRGRLRAEAGQLQVETENLNAAHATLDAQVQAIAGRQVEEFRRQLATTQDLLEVANQEADRIRQELVARERESAALDGLGPLEAAQRLRLAEDDNRRLRQELAERPNAEAVRRLQEIADAHRGCETQLAELRYANGRLEAEIGNIKLGVADLERLRDAENSYRLIITGYQAQVRDLEDRYAQLTDRKNQANPFPGLSNLHDSPAMRVPPRLAADPPDLADLVLHVQSRMAHAEQPLHYRARDIRSFLAGLATSHLHLLEGISGTGKTSLPRAFATAIGAGHELVEVQAGWRDRHDLFGYYNTFERTFHETKFLKALYKAGRPAHATRPFFVVLDEMNLSHVEYYFADLLSKLENPDGKPIELLPAPVGQPLDGLVGGTGIALPDNVWFIGTANNDETTLTFADKTYDRAYLLELPATRTTLDAEALPARTPLSIDALTAAFDRAKNIHKDDGDRIVEDLLNSDLRPELQRLCGIGWGPRIEEQTRTYTAVVRGAGGTVEEAADHVLATKLLRKVRGRYQIRHNHLSSMEKVIRRTWQEAELNGEPGQSLALLEDEKQKR
ncbi:hypothetical protein [Amycolatopsis sp. NPDC003861]